MTNIKFEFSTNNFYVKEYFGLRDKLYLEGLGFNVNYDEYDIKSEHLFITSENKIIGGARLVKRENGNLPMETSFRIQDYLDLGELYDFEIAEVSRISVLNEFRSIELLTEIFKIVQDKCKQEKIKLILTIAPRHIARLTSLVCTINKLNVKVIRNIEMSSTSLYKNLGEMNLVVITEK